MPKKEVKERKVPSRDTELKFSEKFAMLSTRDGGEGVRLTLRERQLAKIGAKSLSFDEQHGANFYVSVMEARQQAYRDEQPVLDGSNIYMQRVKKLAKKYVVDKVKAKVKGVITTRLGYTGHVMTNIPKMAKETVFPMMNKFVDGTLTEKEHTRMTYKGVAVLLNNDSVAAGYAIAAFDGPEGIEKHTIQQITPKSIQFIEKVGSNINYIKTGKETPSWWSQIKGKFK